MEYSSILFNGEMVRAIIQDRKTQTRRPIDHVLGIGKVHDFRPSDTPGDDWAMRDRRDLWNEVDHDGLLARCPYGVVGDRLWVRETWAALLSDSAVPALHIAYRADGEMSPSTELHSRRVPSDKWSKALGYLGRRWRPSIHMPRWASRITLEIMDVSVERLWDLTAEDCLGEGIRPRGMDPVDIAANLLDDFGESWDAIYAERGYGWDVDPWVWVIGFRRVE